MATAQIGALRVSLGLDTAQFSSGLKGVSGKINGFVASATVGLAAVAGAAVLAFGKIRGAADRADDAWKTSQSIGIPIKDLGRLGYAAEMSGASIETLSTGVRKAQQLFTKAANGGVSDATKTLLALGVKVTDTNGRLRPTIDIIGDVAEEFSRLPDGARKTDAAMSIFGKTGAALIPTLNMGRDGLKEMGDEAERMGLVFDEKTAKASENFNDNIMRLNLSMTGLWNRILAGVIPSFSALSGRIVTAVQNGGVLDLVIGGITGAMNLLTKGIGFVVDNLDFLTDLFKIFVGAKLITFMAGMVGSFITFAKSVRVAGLAMALVTSITRAKIVAFALLAAVIAKLTGLYDPLVAKLGELGEAVTNALPASVRETFTDLSEGLRGLMTDIDGTDAAAAESLAAYLGVQRGAEDAFATASRGATEVGQAVDTTNDKVGWLGETLKEVAGTISSGLSGVVKDAIRGGDAIGNLIGKVGDLGDRLIDMAFDQAINGFLQMVVSALTGSGAGFSYGPNVFSDPWAGMRMPGLATGGRTLTAGLVEVGERGKELLNLPAGASVIRHSDVGDAMGSRAMDVTVGVSADANGNLMPFVERVVERRLDTHKRQELPGLVNRINNDPYSVGS